MGPRAFLGQPLNQALILGFLIGDGRAAETHMVSHVRGDPTNPIHYPYSPIFRVESERAWPNEQPR